MIILNIQYIFHIHQFVQFSQLLSSLTFFIVFTCGIFRCCFKVFLYVSADVSHHYSAGGYHAEHEIFRWSSYRESLCLHLKHFYILLLLDLTRQNKVNPTKPFKQSNITCFSARL